MAVDSVEKKGWHWAACLAAWKEDAMAVHSVFEWVVESAVSKAVSKVPLRAALSVPAKVVS